jgi:hypothetical protein
MISTQQQKPLATMNVLQASSIIQVRGCMEEHFGPLLIPTSHTML